MDTVTLRQASPEDFEVLQDFVAEEKWDFSLYDYSAFQRYQQNYLLVAVDESGHVAGSVGMSEQNKELVYIYAFIVRKDLRRQGIGRKLWDALQHFIGDKNIYLDAVVHMAPWYERQGFLLKTFSMYNCSFKVSKDMEMVCDPKEFQLMKLTPDKWSDVLKYTSIVYPSFNQERVLRAWFEDERVEVVLAYDKDRLIGYGSIHQKPNKEYGVRNLFGDSEAVANAVLLRLLQKVPEQTTVRGYCLEGNQVLSLIKERLVVHGSMVRMFTNKPINDDTKRIWMANLS